MATRCGIRLLFALFALAAVVLCGGCRREPPAAAVGPVDGRSGTSAAAQRSVTAGGVPEVPNQEPERVVVVGADTALRGLLPTAAKVGYRTNEFEDLGWIKPPGWDQTPRVSRGPTDFCVDRRGVVYIPGRHGEAVYCFGSDGRFLRRLPSRAKTYGPLEWQAGVDVDDQVRVYFWTWADERDSEILIYESTGKLLGTFPVQGPPNRPTVTPDGVVFVADQPLQFVDGQLRRAPSRPLPWDLTATGPMVVGLDGYVYLLLTEPTMYGFFRYTYDMRPAGAFDVLPGQGEGGMNPLVYRAAGDAAGFLYTEPVLLDAAARRAHGPPPPAIARADGLLPAGMAIYNPARELAAQFYVWEWFWGEARVGHDRDWYVLTYNALEWGPWKGVRVYRYWMGGLRPGAQRPVIQPGPIGGGGERPKG